MRPILFYLKFIPPNSTVETFTHKQNVKKKRHGLKMLIKIYENTVFLMIRFMRMNV